MSNAKEYKSLISEMMYLTDRQRELINYIIDKNQESDNDERITNLLQPTLDKIGEIEDNIIKFGMLVEKDFENNLFETAKKQQTEFKTRREVEHNEN